MITALAVLFPLCTTVVATDAPNPVAIATHENAHCWGWKHPVHNAKPAWGKPIAAPMPGWRWRLLGEYPNKVTFFERHKGVAKLCDGNSYGCQWGGLNTGEK